MRTAFDLSGRLPENSRERHLIRGDYYSLDESSFPLAVEAFKMVLEDHPDDTVANNNLAMLYYDLEDYASAARFADVPIRRDTDNPFPYHTRAISLNALGRAGEAVRLLESYLEERPANRLVYRRSLEVLIDSRDFAAAAAALDRAAAVFPDPSWSYYRGTVLFNTRGAAAAEEEYRKLFLMEEAPWHLKAHVQLGSSPSRRDGSGRPPRNSERGPTLAETTGQHDWISNLRRSRGLALLDAGDPAAARGRSREGGRSGPKSANQGYSLAAALTFQATVQLRLGDLAAAEASAGAVPGPGLQRGDGPARPGARVPRGSRRARRGAAAGGRQAHRESRIPDRPPRRNATAGSSFTAAPSPRPGRERATSPGRPRRSRRSSLRPATGCAPTAITPGPCWGWPGSRRSAAVGPGPWSSTGRSWNSGKTPTPGCRR